MPDSTPTDIDQLAAPEDDGAVLLWPDAARWPELVKSNRALRAGYRFAMAGRDAGALLAESLGRPPTSATGHQPDFWHPGVWAKPVAAEALARCVGGSAICVLVDHDNAGDLVLERPVREAGRWRVRRAGAWDGPYSGSFETAPMLSRSLVETTAGAGPKLLHTFAEHCGAGPDGYCERWERGLHEINRAVDVPHPRFVRTSELFGSAGVSAALGPFLAHVLIRAEAFREAYNGALETYRRRRGIQGTLHPIPDLAADGERLELPFWFVRGVGARRRLHVSMRGDGLELWAGDESAGALPRERLFDQPNVLLDLRSGWRLRPRALTLTMYLRLFACDLFIHGIGGAKYDQITDDIICRFFDIEPPAFVCATATARLPLGSERFTLDDLRRQQRRLRDARFNPQRLFVDAPEGSPAARLIVDRSAAVAETERLRKESRHDRAARRTAFERIRALSAELAAIRPDFVESLRQELREIEDDLADGRILHRRDWFIGLYESAQLAVLANTVDRTFK